MSRHYIVWFDERTVPENVTMRSQFTHKTDMVEWERKFCDMTWVCTGIYDYCLNFGDIGLGGERWPRSADLAEI